MKKIINSIKFFLFISSLLVFLILLFSPIFLNNKTIVNGNLLSSFYNPWSKEKFENWEGGIPNKPIGIDDLRIFYPQRYFTQSVFNSGKIPFWNPYIFSGISHVGLSETAVYYPLYLIFSVIPQLDAWAILIVMQPIIAAVGVYLYARNLKLSHYSVIFASLSFSLSGVVLVRMVEGLSVGHSLIWLPYILWCIHNFFESVKYRYLIGLFVFLLLSLLAGWFQFTFYLFVIGFIYALLQLHTDNIQLNRYKYLIFVPFILVPLASLYQLVPALQMFLLSARSINTYQILSPHLLPLQHLLTFLAPDFWGNPGAYNFFGISEYKESIIYVGVPTFVFALLSFAKTNHDRTYKFFFLTFIGSVLLAFDTNLSKFVLSLPIPIVSSFLPSRIMLLAAFSLCILSAYGIDMLINNNAKYRKEVLYLLLFLPLGMLVLADIYVASTFIIDKLSFMQIDNQLSVRVIEYIKNKLFDIGNITKSWQINVQIKNLVIPHLATVITVLGIFFLLKVKKSFIVIFFIMLLLVGQYYFAQKYYFFSEKQFVFPKHPVMEELQSLNTIDRVVSIGEGYIPSNLFLNYQIYTPDGVGSMYDKRYGELVGYTKSNGKNLNAPRIEARLDPQVAEIFVNQNKYFLRFYQMSGVHYLVVLNSELNNLPPIALNENIFNSYWTNDTWTIFEYADSNPRYYWTNKYKVIEKNEKSLIKSLFLEKDKEIVFLEKEPVFNPEVGTGSVNLLSNLPNKKVFNVKSTVNGLLYLSDTFHPNWKAMVDNQKVELLRANYAFSALSLTAGDHIVTVYYDSTIENIGYVLAIGIVSISLIILLVLSFKKKITL